MALQQIADEHWPQLSCLLNAVERERAARFAFERHRREYQAAHALKRLMLTAAAGGGVAPAAWTFETDARGKPHVVGRASPQFSLSHCDGLVACAVSWRVGLGVDVENLDGDAPLELAGTSFTTTERAWLCAMPAAAQPAGFFRLWTLKEAYLKATGSGLSLPLDDFAFHFNPLRVTFVDPAQGDPAAWRFDQRPVGKHHVLALAWRVDSTDVPVEIAMIRPDLLWDMGERHRCKKRL